MSLTALILNISRGSVHDGLGVRTVIYFKGCNMHCRWCHNPESISHKRELAYFPQKCIGCGKCIEKCPTVHIIDNGIMKLKRDLCNTCGECTKVCPSNALELIGNKKTADDVFEEILKDEHFFEESGGGVTFSGGECLLQSDFVAEFFKKMSKSRDTYSC